ncbi:zinc finger Y-chromosomal protein-like isoform X1 [Cylas formicarius]|uniref:zinc finger Y-chromosomal protein-like isoform X1 n=1 Tax=Cylas formicarius TaxID=197179 RepID=UPI002958A660|nr:zinc finger Y-chromosomal protein-like isoform X1 [Cylas formicarius]
MSHANNFFTSEFIKDEFGHSYSPNLNALIKYEPSEHNFLDCEQKRKIDLVEQQEHDACIGEAEILSVKQENSFAIEYGSSVEYCKVEHDTTKENSLCSKDTAVPQCEETKPVSIGRLVPNLTWLKCSLCAFKTSKESLFHRHVETHAGLATQKTFTCEQCGYQTIYEANLKRHILRHKHIGKAELFQCNMCPYEANLKERLHDHIVNVHSKKQRDLYICSQCNYKTPYCANFKRHCHSHSVLCKCDFCPFQTNFKYKLAKHCKTHKEYVALENHDVKNRFQCEVCNKKLRSKATLTNHQKVHNELDANDIYKCEECEFQTIYKHSLRGHYRVTHATNFTYSCDICPYKGNSNERLKQHKKRHMKIHEVKMLRCDICDYSTVDKSNMNRHSLVHRKDDLVPMYECYICSLKTKYKKNLVAHIKKHAIKTEIMDN